MENSHLDNLFFDLPKPGLSDRVAPFSLWVHYYEKEIARRNGGLDLASSSSIQAMDSEDEDHYQQMVPEFATEDDIRMHLDLARVLNGKQKITKPTALLVKDANELEEHVVRMYQISYAHYVMGKRKNLYGEFPVRSCSLSTWNMALSLASFGYVNAVYAANNEYDHAYPLVPFVMEDSGMRGSIIIDPTSDQLWEDVPGRTFRAKPRNHVFVMGEGEWKYETHWQFDKDPEGPKDLSPDMVVAHFSRKKDRSSSDYVTQVFLGKAPVQQYYREAYRNPIRLSISP